MIAETLAAIRAANYTFMQVPVGSIVFYPNWQFYAYAWGITSLGLFIGAALMFVYIKKRYKLEKKIHGN